MICLAGHEGRWREKKYLGGKRRQGATCGLLSYNSPELIKRWSRVFTGDLKGKLVRRDGGKEKVKKGSQDCE